MSTSSPVLISTPIQSHETDTEITKSFSITINNFFIFYTISIFCCFIYLSIFSKKQIPLSSRFFSSFIAPFVFLLLFTRDIILLIFSTAISFIYNVIIHIIVPTVKLIYCSFIEPVLPIFIRFILIPVIKTLIIIYRKTKNIWSILKKIVKYIFNMILDTISYILANLIFPVLKFIFIFIIYGCIIDLVFDGFIIPICSYISNIHAFQIILNLFADVFWNVLCFICIAFSSISKVCEKIIISIGEIISECYQQIIYPFIGYVKQIF